MELLKLRFGETSLQECVIMIKDVEESKRINNTILELIKKESQNEEESFPLTATIISSFFWPKSKKFEDFKPCAPLQNMIDAYNKHFMVYKKRRKLEWNFNVGFADLELDFGEKTMNFEKVPSIEASIILSFDVENHLTLQSLSESLGLPSDVIKRKIGFWTSKGLIKQMNDDGEISYLLHDGVDEDNSENFDQNFDDNNGNLDDEEEEENETNGEVNIIPYITSMLKNLGAMNLQKIHFSLSMFINDFSQSETELKKQLDQLVQEDTIDFINGDYCSK